MLDKTWDFLKNVAMVLLTLVLAGAIVTVTVFFLDFVLEVIVRMFN